VAGPRVHQRTDRSGPSRSWAIPPPRSRRRALPRPRPRESRWGPAAAFPRAPADLKGGQYRPPPPL
jgi:hypothetical protein